MKQKKQSRARNVEKTRTETLTFRLSKRLRSLAEVAARKKGVTLANHVESALEASLDEPIDFLRGASIAAVADELYDEDDALCFLKRLKKYPWAMNPEQKRLRDLIHTSPLFYPSFRSTTPSSSPGTGPNSPLSRQAQPTPASCRPNSSTASTSSSPS